MDRETQNRGLPLARLEDDSFRGDKIDERFADAPHGHVHWSDDTYLNGEDCIAEREPILSSRIQQRQTDS